MNHDGKHVLVLGLGESGLAMALWLQRCGARLRVADTRAAPARLPQLMAGAAEAAFVGGAFDAALLDGIDLIAVSPGLSPLHELAAISAAADAAGIPVVGEIELFAQALAALRASRDYAPKIIAITGTNGKTTVTRLTGLLCERSGLRTQVAGNISPAALEMLRVALDAADRVDAFNATDAADAVDAVDAADAADTNKTTDARKTSTTTTALPQVWVLELSSFQLEHTFTLAADAATVLNITQDHLDWHGDMAAYIDAKAQIFGPRTVRVLNRDDAVVMGMASPLAPVVTFGAEEATLLGCFGLVEENGMQWLSVATPADDDGQKDGKKRRKKGDTIAAPVLTTRLMPVDALQIRGRHNAVNALAALALCRAVGLPLAPLLHGLRDYRGEPHRVELVTTIGGVAYYDDSKGTNVGATVAALVGLGSMAAGRADGAASRKTLWLIAGGEGKDQDFTPLAAPVARHARAVLLIGRDAGLLRAALTAQASGASGASEAGAAAGGHGAPSADTRATELIDCASLEEAVQLAAERATDGEAVLLSPACASFDMFRDYAHRAEVFVDAVRGIALDRGEVLA